MRIPHPYTVARALLAACLCAAGCHHAADGGSACCADMAGGMSGDGGSQGGGDMACSGAGCGGGGDAGGGDAGAGDMAGPVCAGCATIAMMQADPYAVAVDGTNVYWTAHSDANTDGLVWTQSKSGGAATTLATMQYGPRQIIASGGNLYWNNYFGGEVWQIAPAPSGTSTNQVAAVSYITQFEIDETNHAAYHIEGTVINATPLDGSKTNTLVTPVVSGQKPTALATDGSYVYWLDSGNKTIERTALPSGTATQLQPGLSQPGLIAYFNGELYFTDARSIKKCATTPGGAVTPLATALAAPVTALVVDADGLYWTELANGSVWRRKNSDGEVALIANQQRAPRGIAVDATDVYWADSGTPGGNDGAIMKAAK